MQVTAARPVTWFAVKRGFDLVVASLALLVLLPVLLGLVAAIVSESPANPVFKQRRLGLDGKPFWMFKLRTMVPDAERRRAEVEHLNEVKPPLFKARRDPRVTRVGRFLRASSLDELPQLINVLRGEMSLVGPRPCIPYELEFFAPHHFERFLVPGGVTGLWQVTARARTTFKEALDLDVTYVRSWSLGLDLRLLCRTPVKILKGDSTT